MRRFIGCILAILLCDAGFSDAAASAESPKNILILIADQWRAQAFGYAGDPNVKTPHIDAFERECIDFTNAISSVPVCCPARASLLTGQRALTHGVFLNDVPLSTNAVTLAKVLREHGYDTGYVGKWHLNGDGRSVFIPRERRQGFDYWKVLECTHNYNHSDYFGDTPEKLQWPGYDAFAQTKDAQEYLKSRATNGRPFFFVLSWGPPHDPYGTAPEKYKAMYKPGALKLRGNVEGPANSWRQNLAGYYAHCSALDDCVGEVLRTLSETGLDRNTIVLFTSDHGDMLGSHGLQKKQKPYDESIRVPMLLRCPDPLGVKARRVTPVICSEDIMPTLLGLCGVAVPPSVEGVSYSNFLHGEAEPSDGAVMILLVAPFGEWDRAHGGQAYRGLRTRRYTYVRNLGGPWILFDNESDPLQMTNLVNRSVASTVQAALDKKLSARLSQTHDEFLAPSAYIEKWGWKTNAEGTIPYTR